MLQTFTPKRPNLTASKINAFGDFIIPSRDLFQAILKRISKKQEKSYPKGTIGNVKIQEIHDNLL